MEVDEQPAAEQGHDNSISDMDEDPPEGAVSMTSEPVEPPAVGCGLDSCSCLTLLDATCPVAVFRDLPYMRGVNEEELPILTCRLQRQYEELEENFQELHTEALGLLRKRRVEPKSLVAFLEKIEATRYVADGDGVSQLLVYRDLVGMLREASTLEGVLDVADPHYTCYCYHVLTDILTEYGGDSPSVKYSTHRYMQKVKFYSQRLIAHTPKIFTSPRRRGFAFLLIHVDWDPMKCTLNQLEAFRLLVSGILRLTHYSLVYIGVEMRGSVMVHLYQIPAFLKDTVFSLNDMQRDDLISRKILKMECCGLTEVTKLGEEKYENLLQKTLSSSTEDVNFVTPPSSPPPSPKIIPTIGTEKEYTIDASVAGLTAHDFELTRPGFEGKSYVMYVSDPANNSRLMTMLLCQHIAKSTGPKHYMKVIILVNNYRRAQQISEELGNFLPEAYIKCTTGSDKTAVSTEINITMTTVTVCTTGKLVTAIEDGKTTFKPITLFLIDGCEHAHHETCLEDIFQLMMNARKLEKPGSMEPQVVAFTTNPNSDKFAWSVESMKDNLVYLCGLLQANSGIHLTDKVRSEVFKPLEKESRVFFEVKTIHLRWRKHDIPAMLCIEMEKVEKVVGMVYSLERWNDHYLELVQEKRDSVPQDDPNRARLLAFYDLLTIYCRAVQICKHQEPEDVGPHLLENRPKISGQDDPQVHDVLRSYDRVREEYDVIIKYEISLQTEIARLLARVFSENNEWRGYLFIDRDKDPQEMVNEISSNVHHARPAVLSGKYISLSKLNKKKSDIEAVQAFECEDTRLIISPFELEKFDDISLIDLPSCNFMIRLKRKSTELTRYTAQGEYTLTYVACPERKTFYDICQSLQLTLLEKAVSNMPVKEELKSGIDAQQKAALQSYTNRGYRIRRAIFRRKPPVKKAPFLHQITLRCKTCRIYACHGNQLYTLFIDGARNFVVPYHEFRQRFSVKRFRPIRKVPKQISRLQKMHCNNCNREWGHMCFFPKRGLTLPVLRAKNFYFQIKNSLHKVRMWPDASFYVPALGACAKYFGEDSDVE